MKVYIINSIAKSYILNIKIRPLVTEYALMIKVVDGTSSTHSFNPYAYFGHEWSYFDIQNLRLAILYIHTLSLNITCICIRHMRWEMLAKRTISAFSYTSCNFVLFRDDVCIFYIYVPKMSFEQIIPVLFFVYKYCHLND